MPRDRFIRNNQRRDVREEHFADMSTWQATLEAHAGERHKHANYLEGLLQWKDLPEAARIVLSNALAWLRAAPGQRAPRWVRDQSYRWARWRIAAEQGAVRPPYPSTPEQVEKAKRFVADLNARVARRQVALAPFLRDPTLLPKRPPRRPNS